MRLGLVLGGATKAAIDTYTTLEDEQRKKEEADYLREVRARDRAYITQMTAATAKATGQPVPAPPEAPQRATIGGAIKNLFGAGSPAQPPPPASPVAIAPRAAIPTAPAAPAPALPVAAPEPAPPAPRPAGPPLARTQGDAPSAVPGGSALRAPSGGDALMDLSKPLPPTTPPEAVKASVLAGFRPPSDYYQTMALASAQAGKGEEAQMWLGKFYEAKANASIALVMQAADTHGDDGLKAISASIGDGSTLTITPITDGDNKGMKLYQYGDIQIVAGSSSEFALKYGDRVRNDPAGYVEHTLKFEDRRHAELVAKTELALRDAQIKQADAGTRALTVKTDQDIKDAPLVTANLKADVGLKQSASAQNYAQAGAAGRSNRGGGVAATSAAAAKRGNKVYGTMRAQALKNLNGMDLDLTTKEGRDAFGIQMQSLTTALSPSEQADLEALTGGVVDIPADKPAPTAPGGLQRPGSKPPPSRPAPPAAAIRFQPEPGDPPKKYVWKPDPNIIAGD